MRVEDAPSNGSGRLLGQNGPQPTSSQTPIVNELMIFIFKPAYVFFIGQSVPFWEISTQRERVSQNLREWGFGEAGRLARGPSSSNTPVSRFFRTQSHLKYRPFIAK